MHYLQVMLVSPSDKRGAASPFPFLKCGTMFRNVAPTTRPNLCGLSCAVEPCPIPYVLHIWVLVRDNMLSNLTLLPDYMPTSMELCRCLLQWVFVCFCGC